MVLPCHFLRWLSPLVDHRPSSPTSTYLRLVLLPRPAEVLGSTISSSYINILEQGASQDGLYQSLGFYSHLFSITVTFLGGWEDNFVQAMVFKTRSQTGIVRNVEFTI